MTQTGITDFERDANTGIDSDDMPPKPAIKNNTEYDVICLVATWSEQTFREQARQILECINPINDDQHTGIINELVESPDPVEPDVAEENTSVEIHGHLASIELQTSAIDAAINSDAERTFLAIHDITAIGRDIEEIRERCVEVLDAGVTITVTTTGNIDPAAAGSIDAILQSIGDAGDRVIPETEASDLVNDDERNGGRPPIGFEAEGGQLQKSDDYHDVRAALKAVLMDDMSKAAAARVIGCAAKTVTRAIEDNPDRYQL